MAERVLLTPWCPSTWDCIYQEEITMSNPQNEAVVRRFFDYMSQPNTQSELDQIVTPNWVNNDSSLEAIMGYPFRGIEGARQLHDFFWKPFSDLKLTIESMCSDGEWVAGHFRIHGRNTGDFMGMPATGRNIDITATGMFRCQNGRVLENVVNPDALGMLQQLGVTQLPSQRKAA
jgi:predicted ester cyclase